MILEDTIVAIATASGLGGVGIVRLSGPSALDLAKTFFSKKTDTWQPQQLYYGFVQGPNGQTLDDGYVVWFKAPYSFTGQDVVEFQIHGSAVVLNQLVGLCIEQGARLALPGEFTKRAFLNGKMDLIQAESVAELIASQSEAEALLARKRLDGKLSSHIEDVRKLVIEVLSHLEADVDFPEEEIQIQTIQTLLSQHQSIISQLDFILKSYQQNQRIQQGFQIAFVGQTNAGKSSFFNALLNQERAIVTDIAGTTRDTIGEEITINGYRVRLIDTAGIREDSTDVIEQEGMQRSYEQIQKADLICVIADITQPMNASLLDTVQTQTPKWLIWNKIDLDSKTPEPQKDFEQTFCVSAKTKQGLDGFLDALTKKLKDQLLLECGGGISNDRQRKLIQTCRAQVLASEKLLQEKTSPEFIAFEFRKAFQCLNQLLGLDENLEEVYDHIFSKFCIGK